MPPPHGYSLDKPDSDWQGTPYATSPSGVLPGEYFDAPDTGQEPGFAGTPYRRGSEGQLPGEYTDTHEALPLTEVKERAGKLRPALNGAFAKPGPYVTTLGPDVESQFQSWVKQNRVPWQDTPDADYDMRGYYKAMIAGDPHAQQAANLHFPDTWKTPHHKTFSNESIYATALAPHWKGKKLVDGSGRVLADESQAEAKAGTGRKSAPKIALPKGFKLDAPAPDAVPFPVRKDDDLSRWSMPLAWNDPVAYAADHPGKLPPLMPDKPKPLSAAEKEFSRHAPAGSAFVRPKQPAPKTYAEESEQVIHPPKPVLVPEAPLRIAEPTGPRSIDLTQNPPGSLWGDVRAKVESLTEPTTNHKDTPLYGAAPTKDDFGKVVTEQDRADAEGLANTAKRVGRVLFGIADLGPQAYNAAKDAMSDDPQVAADGESRLLSLHPGAQIANRLKEVKADYRRDPKLALENVAGDVAGIWLAGKATAAAERGFATLKDTLTRRLPTISPEGEVLSPRKVLASENIPDAEWSPVSTVEGSAEFAPSEQPPEPGTAQGRPRVLPGGVAAPPAATGGEALPFTPENIEQIIQQRAGQHAQTVAEVRSDLEHIAPGDRQAVLDEIHRIGVEAYQNGDLAAAGQAAAYEHAMQQIINEATVAATAPDVPEHLREAVGEITATMTVKQMLEELGAKTNDPRKRLGKARLAKLVAVQRANRAAAVGTAAEAAAADAAAAGIEAVPEAVAPPEVPRGTSAPELRPDQQPAAPPARPVATETPAAPPDFAMPQQAAPLEPVPPAVVDAAEAAVEAPGEAGMPPMDESAGTGGYVAGVAAAIGKKTGKRAKREAAGQAPLPFTAAPETPAPAPAPTAENQFTADGHPVPAKPQAKVRWDKKDQQAEATAPKGYVGPDGEATFVATKKEFKTKVAAQQAAEEWLKGIVPEGQFGAGAEAPAQAVPAAPATAATPAAPDMPTPETPHAATPAAETPAAPVKAKPARGKAAQEKAAAEQKLAEHFTPGNVIFNGYWKSYDKVLAFQPETAKLPWSVEVIQVDKDGNPVPGEGPRRHSTYPSKGDMVVSRASVAAPTAAPAPAAPAAAPETPKPAPQAAPPVKLARVAGAAQPTWEVPGTGIAVHLQPNSGTYTVYDGPVYVGYADSLEGAKGIAAEAAAQGATPDALYSMARARSLDENATLAEAKKAAHRDIPIIAANDDAMVLLDRMAGRALASNGLTLSEARADEIVGELRTLAAADPETRKGVAALADMIAAHRTPHGNAVLHRSAMDEADINRVVLEELFHDWQHHHGLVGKFSSAIDKAMLSGPSAEIWEAAINHLMQTFGYRAATAPVEAPAWIASGYDKFGITPADAAKLLADYFDAAESIVGSKATDKLPPIAAPLEERVRHEHGSRRGDTGKNPKDISGRRKGRVDTLQSAERALSKGRAPGGDAGDAGAATAPATEVAKAATPNLQARSADGQPRPHWLAAGAQRYTEAQGRQAAPAPVVPVDPRAMEIADAFEAMEHDPHNPEVKASYDALTADLRQQWDYATKEMGVAFEPWDRPGQPYSSSTEMKADVDHNHHLYFFRGVDMPADHPMAAVDPTTGLSYNEMMRAVHDLFGHAVRGHQFGPKGEENAWVDHAQMFPVEAIPALVTETKGQNSWWNYGPHMRDAQGNLLQKGDAGWLAPPDRPFGRQKTGLLPQRFHYRPDAPASFISPNKFDLSLSDAERRLKSRTHAQFVAEARALAKAVGVNVIIADAMGSWQNGAENSIAMHYPVGTDPELVRWVEANLGRLGHQNATGNFIPSTDGNDSAYKFWVDGKKVSKQELSDLLVSNGIGNSTIESAKDGNGVTVIGEGDGFDASIDKIAGELEVKNVRKNKGVAEFPGDYGDRDAAGRFFLGRLEEIESRRPSLGLGEIRRGWENRPDYIHLYRAIREAAEPFTKVTHGSPTRDLAVIKPSFHGGGPQGGAETIRKHTFPQWWVDRSYFQIEGTDGEPFYQNMPQQYHATFNAENLYNLYLDPDNLRAQIPVSVKREGGELTYFEKLIRDAGYDGYYTDENHYHGFSDPKHGMVVAFHDTPVEAKLKAGELKLPPDDSQPALQNTEAQAEEQKSELTSKLEFKHWFGDQATYDRMVSGNVPTEEIRRLAPRRFHEFEDLQSRGVADEEELVIYPRPLPEDLRQTGPLPEPEDTSKAAGAALAEFRKEMREKYPIASGFDPTSERFAPEERTREAELMKAWKDSGMGRKRSRYDPWEHIRTITQREPLKKAELELARKVFSVFGKEVLRDLRWSAIDRIYGIKKAAIDVEPAKVDEASKLFMKEAKELLATNGKSGIVSPMPHNYFHGTDPGSLHGILKDGLRADKVGENTGGIANRKSQYYGKEPYKGTVFLAEHLSGIRPYTHKAAVRYRVPYSFWKAFDSDDIGDAMYHGDIPAKYITEYYTHDDQTNKWTRHRMPQGKQSAPDLQSLQAEAQRRDPRAEPAPVWYLKSNRVIADKMKGPMPGLDLLRMLNNNGVSPDELKWTGLDDYLPTAGKVTPDDVKNFISENGIKVEEVVKGAGMVFHKPFKTEKELRQAISGDEMLEHSDGTLKKGLSVRSVAGGWNLFDERSGDAKYSGYQEPGGENYRELLLTLPKAPQTTPIEFTKVTEYNGEPVYSAAVRGGQASLHHNPGFPWRVDLPNGESMGGYNTAEEAMEAVRRNPRYQFVQNPEEFRSRHWEEPNVLAHVRMNDRTTPDGEKLLHIEEVQSDWHQKGRKEGYADRFPEVNKVPDAPFKKNWQEMALRRIIRHAAENGYDGISWTGGDKQAERYRLSNRISKVDYTPSTFGPHGLLEAYDLKGKRVISEHVGQDELADRIGKEAADRLAPKIEEWKHDSEIELTPKFDEQTKEWFVLDGNGDPILNRSGERVTYAAEDEDDLQQGIEYKKKQARDQTPVPSLQGIDLNIGGEGMKGFYDKIIPDYLNKFGKKFGARVEKTETGAVSQQKHDMLKNDLDTKYERFRRLTNELRDLDPASPGDYNVAYLGKQEKVRLAEEAYHKALDAFREVITRPTLESQYLPIPEAMRDSALDEGMTLFSLQAKPPQIAKHFEGDNFSERRAAIVGAGNAYDPDSLLTGEEQAKGMTYENSYRDYPSQAEYDRITTGQVPTEEILRIAPRRKKTGGVGEIRAEAYARHPKTGLRATQRPVRPDPGGIAKHFEGDNFSERRAAIVGAGNAYDPDSLLTGEETAKGMTYTNSYRAYPSQAEYDRIITRKVPTEEVLRMAPRRFYPGEKGGDLQSLKQTIEAERPRVTATPEFQRWFGKSEIVDQRGKPKVMYHATTSDIQEFRPYTHIGTRKAAESRNKTLLDFYVNTVNNPARAAGANTMPVYVRIENPLRLPDLADIDDHTGQPMREAREQWKAKGKQKDDEPYPRGWEGEEAVATTLLENGIINIDEFEDHRRNDDALRLLKEKGYDGIVYKNVVEDPGHDSYVVFDPKQIKSAIGNRGSFNPDDADILQSKRKPEQGGSTVPLMESMLLPHYRGVGAIAAHLQDNTRRTLRPFLPGDTPALRERMVERAVRVVSDELKYQLAQENSGADWYTSDIRGDDNSLMTWMKKIHPELKDPAKERMFLLHVAATSPGKAAAFDNVNIAEQAYELYKQTGKIPLKQIDGTPWGSYGNAPLKTAEGLLKHFKGDEAKAMEWILSRHPLSELETVKARSGYSRETVKNALPPDHNPEAVYGAYILGPKVGPFFLNLNGISTELTVDRWFMRTWNRVMGTLVEPDKHGDMVVLDVPRGKSERGAMLDAVEQIKKKFGLETSQVQGALWYYEQGLYWRLGQRGTFGGTYANAAKDVYGLRSKGYGSLGEAYAAERDDAPEGRMGSGAGGDSGGVRPEDSGGEGEGQGDLFRDRSADASFPFGQLDLQSLMAEKRRRDPRRASAVAPSE